MIAYVLTGSAPAGPWSPEMRELVEEAVAHVQGMDGVEGVLSLFDPSTGKTVGVTLLRDEGALGAFEAFTDAKVAEARMLNPDVETTGHVYREVIGSI
jgi:hypothetical protein